MIATLGLSADYKYVLALAVSTGFLVTWQSILVSKARKAAGVPYPRCWVPDAEADRDIKAMRFNCAQRAHGNTLESLPFFLFSLLYVGLTKPITASVLGALWVSGRILYTWGYTTGEAKKRMMGVHHNIGFFGLLLTSGYIAVKSLIA